MQNTEMGFFSLTVDNKTFNLTPSLKNMGKIASATDLLGDFDMLFRESTDLWMRLSIAKNVLLSCSDSEDIDFYLVGVSLNLKPHYNKRCISANDQVNVAISLMRHGIVGVNCPDYEGSKKAKGKVMDKFDVNQIISDARMHLDCTKQEAQDLTMTEFRYLLSAKFPSEATQAKNEAPSLESHNAMMKAMMEVK